MTGTAAAILAVAACIATSHATQFIVYADTRSNKARHDQVLSLIDQRAPELILNCGDLADGYRDEFIAQLQSKSNVKNLLDKNLYLVSKGSDVHDSQSWLFGLRPTVVRDNSVRYAFTVGNCFFVCNGTSATADVWLAEQLGSAESKAARYRFIFQHSPVYSSGKYLYQGKSGLESYCDQYDVTMVFTGHSHHFERSKVIYGQKAVESGADLTSNKGTIYMVNGGGGAELYTMQGTAGWWTAARQLIHHFIVIDAQEDKLTYTVVSVNDQVIDQFTWRKGAATQVAAPVIAPQDREFAEDVDVTITTATPGASIYYTLDGTDPTQSSTVYTAPFTLTASATVKARAFQGTLVPSDIATAVFSKLGAPELTTVQVTPASASVAPGGAVQFSAAVLDQFGDPYAASLTWTTDCPSSVGTVDARGLFTAGTQEGGPCGISASAGSITGTARVSVSTELVVSDISRPSYTVGEVQLGKPLYHDRDGYTFKTVPGDFLGLPYIRTAYSNDYNITDPAFLSFTVNTAVTVYVAVCMTNMSGDTPAAEWLRDGSWKRQAEDITINHYDAARQTYAVFARSFDAGVVTLGGNEGVQNMYSVIMGPSGGGAVETVTAAPQQRGAGMRVYKRDAGVTLAFPSPGVNTIEIFSMNGTSLARFEVAEPTTRVTVHRSLARGTYLVRAAGPAAVLRGTVVW